MKYGPEAPGRGKPSIFVYFFPEWQSWCSLGKEGIKDWSSDIFPKLPRDLNYWKKNSNKIFIFSTIFLMDLLRFFFIISKPNQLRPWKSPLIWHLRFFYCILWKRAWSELSNTPPTWFNLIYRIWMLIIHSWEIFRKSENWKISQLRTAGKHARLIGFIYIWGVWKVQTNLSLIVCNHKLVPEVQVL